MECFVHVIRFASIHLQQRHSGIIAGFLFKDVITQSLIGACNARKGHKDEAAHSCGKSAVFHSD
jgi:hypothetical protein